MGTTTAVTGEEVTREEATTVVGTKEEEAITMVPINRDMITMAEMIVGTEIILEMMLEIAARA